jgi:catechol-2,3-dioxygenase
MPVTLHHVVVDAHDLPKLARFWSQALGWKVLSEREREIVIGPDVNAPTGMCFMPVTDACAPPVNISPDYRGGRCSDG